MVILIVESRTRVAGQFLNPQTRCIVPARKYVGECSCSDHREVWWVDSYKASHSTLVRNWRSVRCLHLRRPTDGADGRNNVESQGNETGREYIGPMRKLNILG